jgi:hypothetical protein
MLMRVDLLILDDFALQPLDPLDTADATSLWLNATGPLPPS